LEYRVGMSDIIKLLPDHIANQIAAGEVIQRPSSVVKELIENSIDAGASRIDLLVKDSGRTLIQLVDNGKGMSTFDAQMCFERHATSKISKADDLFALSTKGFRGEALASIAAISHVTLKTKLPGEELGSFLQMEGSKILQQEPVVCANGTSFEVKNLFYNIPARRNFLKTDSIELRHILTEVERIALTHPEVYFTFKHNDTDLYNLPNCSLKKRIIDILGKKSVENLVPIEESTEIVELKGFVGKPEFAKKKRGEQFLFVNNRFFKDTFFNHAITQAFDGLLAPKTFPSYFLYLTIDPQKIDVNVHPTKTEIKFEEDRLIYAIILSSVRQALGKYNIAPSLDFTRETSFDLPASIHHQTPVVPTIKINENYNPFHNTTYSPKTSGSSGFSQAIKAEGFGNSKIQQQEWDNFYGIKEDQSCPEQAEIDFEEAIPEKKEYLLRGNYLITSCKSGLMVIHHRRAQHRIIYDRIMDLFRSTPVPSQKLLFPFEKELSIAEKNDWTENSTMLRRLGFEADFQNLLLKISAIPAVLQEDAIDGCLNTLLENISFRDIQTEDIAHVLINSIARSSSRKKNVQLSSERWEALIEDLFQCSEHSYTPTGKAIINTITLEEIANKF
jgi:DNA mismatch repair protein MutL